MQSIQALTGAQAKLGIAVFGRQKPAALRRAEAKRAHLEAAAQQEIDKPGSQLGKLNRSKLSWKTLRYIKRRVRETFISTRRDAIQSRQRVIKQSLVEQQGALSSQIQQNERTLENQGYWKDQGLQNETTALRAQLAEITARLLKKTK